MGDRKFTLLMEPVTFYRDDECKPVIVSGYRRLQALRLLARQHGLDPEMQIPAVEVPKPVHEESKGDDDEE